MLEYFFSCWGETTGNAKNVKENALVFDAYKENIKPCIHCGHCKTAQGCVYGDFAAVERGLREADILVVASPVYVLGFPAPLKAVFDRTQQYFEAKFSAGVETPVKKRKAALFLASFGSTDGSGVQMMESQLRVAFKLMNAELVQTVTSPNTDSAAFDSGAVKRNIEDAVRRLRLCAPLSTGTH
jgi:multimeric flavodoxin WrbA